MKTCNKCLIEKNDLSFYKGCNVCKICYLKKTSQYRYEKSRAKNGKALSQ